MDLLSPPDFEGGNQQEVYNYAQEAVHKSLKEGLFLRGGEDENVSFFFVLVFLSYIYCFV
jgi:HEPN domain-containing protein